VNVAEFLQASGLAGQLYETSPIRSLLVSVDTAFQECEESLHRQDLKMVPASQFLKVLDKHDIAYGSNHKIWKLRDRQKRDLKQKGHIDMSLLELLADKPEISKQNVGYDGKIVGRNGHIKSEGVSWFLHTDAHSKRHLTETNKKLSFMELIGNAQFTLDRMPTVEEAAIIRKVVGLKKRPTMTNERRKSLQEHAAAIRGGPPAKVPSEQATSA
jgi:hypothetical protein